MKTIYRDFNHWFSTSKAHGFSSASRECAEEIWDDFQPTIEASQDDYKKAYIELMQEKTQWNSKLVDALFEYMEKYKKEDSPKFWRWYIDNK
jgi:hypothetical protein